MEAMVAELFENEIRFSKHASKRLEKREIEWTSAMAAELKNAVHKLEQKGGQCALVMFNQLAMLVSISKRTVITVIGREQLQNNLFTDIDSVIFIA